jgi:hypothetical protein
LTLLPDLGDLFHTRELLSKRGALEALTEMIGPSSNLLLVRAT